MRKRLKSMAVRQRDLKDCGPACISSLAAYYGKEFPVARIRQIAGTDQKGTSAYGLIKALEKLGFSAKGVRTEIKTLGNIPLPAIVHLIIDQRFHHYMVLLSVDRKKVRLMDPSRGNYIHYNLEEFAGIWSGVAIIAAPGESLAELARISNSKRFQYLMRPHGKTMIQIGLGALIYTILGLSTSIYIQKLTDYIVQFQLWYMLHIAGIVMLLIVFFQLILGTVKNMLVLRTGQLIDMRLILGYYKHLLNLSQNFFDSMRVGEIISRIGDAAKIRSFLSDTSVNLVLNILILFFSIVLMLCFHLKLTFIVLMFVPAYAIIYILTNKLNKQQERKAMEKAAEVESHLVESLRGIRTVKLMNLEEYMSHGFEKRFTDLLDISFKSGRVGVISVISSEFISRTITILLLWFGASLVLKQELSLGQLMSFFTIAGYLSSPAKSIISFNRSYQQAVIAADRIFEVMDLDNEAPPGRVEICEGAMLNIAFQSVHFSYGTRGVTLKDISFDIPHGKIALIKGESGSGKSTIVNLLSGLYPLQEGKIEINGLSIKDYCRTSLNNRISIVPQHIDLFSGSILENIAPGEFNPDVKHAIELCKRLGLNKLLDNLPGGIYTRTSEHGNTLSGGERQRLAIARALYKDPSIIIFDEAFSALDSETEDLVMQLVHGLKCEGKTIIIVSHRENSLKFADLVIDLRNGEIQQIQKTFQENFQA